MAEFSIKYADKRTFQRYITNGTIDEKDMEKHLKGLPDLAEQAVAVESVLDEDDYDDEEDDDDEVEE
jgi:nitrogen regulatory protein PII-like uncharacterized protein